MHLQEMAANVLTRRGSDACSFKGQQSSWDWIGDAAVCECCSTRTYLLRISPHVPVSLRIVDALPRAPSMKVDLRAVRTLFDAPRGTQA